MSQELKFKLYEMFFWNLLTKRARGSARTAHGMFLSAHYSAMKQAEYCLEALGEKLDPCCDRMFREIIVESFM